MANVWVFGANGMLGSRVGEELTQNEIQFAPVTRSSLGKCQLGVSQFDDFEAMRGLEKLFGAPTHIVNAIGVVKPRINEAQTESVVNAIQGNSLFPRNLGTYCETNKVHLIQIATDCVYSGTKGNYLESDLHDPTDVYGKTKSLGEFSSDYMSLIRCSIIGRENENKYSLVEWVNSQLPDASINGFTNHNWNGVTTKVFGMIAAGIIQSNLEPVGKFHLIPQGKVSKYELVNLIKNELGRKDIKVNEFRADVVIDRTLSTELRELNIRIWASAGFKSIPTISEMVTLGL
jgi:dTDP-4-dehydrorhamnose reductase